MEEEKELTKRERKRLNRESSQGEKSTMKNKLLTLGGIIAVAIGAFFFLYRGGGENTPVEPVEIVSPGEVSTQDHVKGPESAAITLVEYGDFQCPACASYSSLVNQLSEEFKDDMRVVFRHYPLRSIHRHAQIASQAAEAANQQGKFWEFHDVLFEKQSEWANVRDPRSLFKEYAENLGLDVNQLDEYMNSSEARERVDADYDSGFAAGINSTPTFFVNGEKISSPPGLEPFRQLIQQILDEKKTQEESPSPESEITPTL